MVETSTRRRLRWVMALGAFGLVAGTTWPLVADPATGPVVAIGQLLAVGGAVATFLVTASLARSGRATDADGPSPDAAVGVLGSMTGMLAVTSTSPPGRLALGVVVVGGAIGLLGGITLFLAARGRD